MTRLNENSLPFAYWDLTTKISYLQRRIIVYSLMYYELDESCISDKRYDCISNLLVKLMNQATSEELELTDYNYAMYDYDGSSGFDLKSRLNEKDKKYLLDQARWILNKWKGIR